MRSALSRFIPAALILLLLIFALDYKWGSLPRIAPFFSPFEGFWMQASGKEPPSGQLNFGLPGLKEAVDVSYDSLGVPHIFAKNDHDLYFMQGFVTARDRLWQMEIQSYEASGRLSEILGPSMLDYDRYQRNFGKMYGAEHLLEVLNQDSTSKNMVDAYTAGVNAWINTLDSRRDYPIEYKLLDIEPEQWSPLKSALLMMSMTYTLAGYSRDLGMTRARMAYGQEWVDKYLVGRTEWMDPIIPSQDEWKQWDVEQPERPADADSIPSFVADMAHKNPEEGNGSNNWAIHGSKTASGYPILANDPHLNMTAPSIWYQIQLHAPGVNTVGASIPGAPTVIIGYNEHIAWGETNVDADVLDYYALEMRQPTPSVLEYKFEGEWKAAEARLETYHVRGEESVTERVFYTVHGPVFPDKKHITDRRNAIPGVAMKWIGHKASNTFRTFYKLNRARNYEEYVESLEDFSGPAQNFVFASNEGDIALWVNGHFPNKWEGQGRYILDGSREDHLWADPIPHEHNPHMKNPGRGFVSSANQRSAAADYPYWLQDSQASFSRGKRINERLSGMESATVQDMIDLQMDSFNYTANVLLPVMLKYVEGDKNPALLKVLRNWDAHHRADEVAPTLWEEWHDTLYDNLTMDEIEVHGLYRPKKDMMTHCIINEPNSTPWFDDIRTQEVEDIATMINKSWEEAVQKLEERLGDDPQQWQWYRYNKVQIRHIAQIPGMGFKDIKNSGSALSVNAIRAPSHGPSWRMVVKMGPEVQGYGIYPGGQSGNPGSPWYDNMLPHWIDGKLAPIEFYKSAEDALNQAQFSIFMRAGRKDPASRNSSES